MPHVTYEYADGDRIIINGIQYSLREDPDEGYDCPQATATDLKTIHFELEELYRDYWWSAQRVAWVPRR